MIDDKTLRLLRDIVMKNMTVIDRLQEKHQLSRRQLEYAIDKINTNIISQLGSYIVFKEDYLIVTDDTRKFLEHYLLKECLEDIYFSKESRINLIFLQIATSSDYLSINHIIGLVSNSKTTIINDINILRTQLKLKGIEIEYNRKNGYQLKGNEQIIRYLVIKVIADFLSTSNGEYILNFFMKIHLNMNSVHYIREIKSICQNDKIEFFENKLKEFSFSVLILKNRLEKYDIKFNHYVCVEKIEYDFSKWLIELLEITNPNALMYVYHWVLSQKIGDISEKTHDQIIVQEIVVNIVDRFESLAGIRFSNREKAIKQLYSHFRPTYYRLLYHFPIYNPLFNTILKEYTEFFVLTQEALKSLEGIFGREIPDDEIAYIAIHFASFTFDYIQKGDQEIRSLIICPLGIGTSAILKVELEKLFPNMIFTSNDRNMLENAELIFTTVMTQELYQSDIPVFVVNPILTLEDKNSLIRSVNIVLNSQYNKIEFTDRVIEILKKHISKSTLNLILDEIYKGQNLLKERGEELLLSHIVSPELIQIGIEARDWEDAIRKSAEPLLGRGIVTQNYIEDMISIAKETGPYIVITKNVALPHARPEAGAQQIAISISTLKIPVNFGNELNDPVKYIFSLSAIDSSTHLNAMAELAELLEDDGFYKVLNTSSSAYEIFNYIRKFEEKK